MKISQIDIHEFCSLLNEFKEEVSQNMDQWSEEGDHIHIMLNSIDILSKELKGVDSLDDLSLERKKVLFPHIMYVYNYMNYLSNDEDPFDDEFYDEFSDEEWMDDCDEEDFFEEEEEEETEEDKPVKKIPVAHKKEHECCRGTTCQSTGKAKKK